MHRGSILKYKSHSILKQFNITKTDFKSLEYFHVLNQIESYDWRLENNTQCTKQKWRERDRRRYMNRPRNHVLFFLRLKACHTSFRLEWFYQKDKVHGRKFSRYFYRTALCSALQSGHFIAFIGMGASSVLQLLRFSGPLVYYAMNSIRNHIGTSYLLQGKITSVRWYVVGGKKAFKKDGRYDVQMIYRNVL